MNALETPETSQELSKKQTEILDLITTYRYMTLPQIRRKMWGSDRKAQIQLSKHFSETHREELKKNGLNEREDVFWTDAKGVGGTHQITIVDVLLDLEEEAKSKELQFHFTYRWVSDFLRPDATVIFSDGNKILLCYIEVHLETEDERELQEKLDKYRVLAKGGFKHVWRDQFSEWGEVEEYSFRVLIYSKKPRIFHSPRFISLVIGEKYDVG